MEIMTCTKWNQQHDDKTNYKGGRLVQRNRGIERKEFLTYSNNGAHHYQKGGSVMNKNYTFYGVCNAFYGVKLPTISKKIWTYHRLMPKGRQPKVERTKKYFLMIFMVMCCIFDVGNTQFISRGHKYEYAFATINVNHSSRAVKVASGLHARMISQSKGFIDYQYSTLGCDDEESYRNPIDGLDCAKHEHTNCIYRSDLNHNQIIKLIRSCPISCKVPCESSFSQPTSTPTAFPIAFPIHELDITFNISSISGLMNEGTTNNFQRYIHEYFLSTLKESKEIHNTTLESVLLKSQDLVDSRNLRTRDMKSLTYERPLSSSPILVVVVSIKAASPNEIAEELDFFFLQSIESEFERKLRSESDPFFKNATVSTRPQRIRRTPKKSPTPYVVIISCVLLIICFVVAIGFIHHRRTRTTSFANLSPMKLSVRGTAIYAAEDSYAAGIKAGVEDAEPSSNQLSAIPSHHINYLEQNPQHLNVLREKTMASPKKSFPTESTIPPMIVIDNIEDELPNTHSQSESSLNVGVEDAKDIIQPNNVEDHSGMRVKRIEALSASYNVLYPSQDEESNSGLSPKSLISSRRSLCDTASAVSTPATAKVDDDERNFGNKVYLTEKTLYNFKKDNDVDAKDKYIQYYDKSMKAGCKSDGKRFNPFKRLLFRQKDKISCTDTHSPFRTPYYESDAELSISSASIRERDRYEISQNPPNDPYLTIDTQQTHISNRMNNQKVINDWIGGGSMADNTDSLLEGELNSVKQASGKNMSIDENSICDLDLVAKHTQTISRESSSTFHSGSSSGGSVHTAHNRSPSDISNESFFFYSFWAPSSSKLGIDFHPAEGSGALILQVKDYSPLYGRVECGDKVVAVDDVNTCYMSTSQILGFLSIKRADKDTKDGRIKITVMSNNKKCAYQPDENGALNYNTMNSDSTQSPIRQDTISESPPKMRTTDDPSLILLDTIGSHESDNETTFHMMAGCESEDDDSFCGA